jgi:IS30 family transposase
MKTLRLHHAPMKHFTPEQRSILQRLWNVNANRGKDTRLSMRAFAQQHGMSYETTRRELHRGMEGKIFRDKIKNEYFYPEYCASKAQAHAADKNANKGTGMKITNQHANAFQRHVLELKKSPAHARHDMIKEGHKNVPCTSTFYNHIDHADIGVLRGQTPYHPGQKRKRKQPVHKARKCPGNLSIEDRPPQVGDRTEFGHWEMDTVVSCVGGKGGLLTLIERMTRLVFIVRLPAITAQAVQNAIRKLLKGGALKHVRSITTDNGCEFLDSQALARLFKNINADLKVYYTHAYAAWEKGSVENANRHIRRFHPKGTDFHRIPQSRITATQDFINSIPRNNSLKGKTAHEAFRIAA